MFGVFAFKADMPTCMASEGIAQPINLLDELSSNPAIEAQIARSIGEAVNVTE